MILKSEGNYYDCIEIFYKDCKIELWYEEDGNRYLFVMDPGDFTYDRSFELNNFDFDHNNIDEDKTIQKIEKLKALFC